jgi:transposase
VKFRREPEEEMAWRRGQTYSQDLRERVLAARDLTSRQAAERFGVSVSYVVKARQRLARTGSSEPRPQKPATARKLVPFHAALQARTREVPDATLAEHREWLIETHGVMAGLTTIWKTLRHLKLTRKKKVAAGRRTRPAGRGRGAAVLDRPAARTGRATAGLPR